MDDRIPTKLANSFARTTGLEREDLLQEARIAYWQAEQAYDPHKGAWSTMATNCVYRRMCSAARRQSRQPLLVPLREDDVNYAHPKIVDAVDDSPSQLDRVEFADLLRGLPEDARTIVSLVLSDAQALAGMTRSGARGELRKKLEGDWSPRQIDRAFKAIARALKYGGTPARTRWA